MSATLSESKPTLFDESATMADVMKPGYPETDKLLERWTSYISYAGTYDVDVHGQRVLHHVVVSKFPNNAGKDQVRAFEFGKEEGTGIDTLQLSATFTPQNHVLLWKRAGQQSGPARRGRCVRRKLFLYTCTIRFVDQSLFITYESPHGLSALSVSWCDCQKG